MDGITTVTTKGQVTIPEAVRQALQVRIGDKVAFTKVLPSHKEAVIKIIPVNIVDELAGSLSPIIKVSDYKTARKGAERLLLKKYRIK